MKAFLLKFIFSILIVSTFFSCSSNEENTNQGGKLKGDISISGAFALYPLALKWGGEFTKIHPDVRVNVQPGGAGKGMADALSQQVHLGMVSREINEEELKKGAWFIPVTKDAVVPTFNSNNPSSKEILEKGITKEQFIQLWIEGKPLTWNDVVGSPSKDPVKVYTRADAAGAAESWAKYFGKKQDDLKGIGVTGDPGLVQAVKSDVAGVGFNNIIYAYNIKTKLPNEGINIIPIDINGNRTIDPEESFYAGIDEIHKAIADGKYPSPPARELYFVSQGKPTDPLVLEFLKWVLTDGQKYVKEAGFIKLTEDKVAEAQGKLK